jgi:2-polyprenyl-3-methyl-5-hydroxy-6-metoxy-1,4-benzoquinol methylase
MENERDLQVRPIHDSWENYWRKNKDHKMTCLGKMITKQKQRKLMSLVSEFQFVDMIDVGSGLGFCLDIFHHAGVKATGIDVSKTAVDVCLKKGFNASQRAVEDVKDSYDLVFSDGLLEHYINFRRYAGELIRISNKYVLIIQSDHQTVMMRLLLLLEQIFRKGQNIYEYNYRIKDFVNYFEEEGYELIRHVPVFCYAFKILLFKKTE